MLLHLKSFPGGLHEAVMYFSYNNIYCAVNADDNIRIPDALTLCMSSATTPSAPLLVYNSTKNPHSRALGERIAGWVLLGTAVFNFILAVPYGEAMDDSNMDGDVVTALIFTEGGIRALLGGAFLTTGYIKYGKWKAWNAQHSNKKFFPCHLALNFEF